MMFIQILVSPRTSSNATSSETAGYRAGGRAGMPKPWGDLDYLPVALSRPDAFFTNLPAPPQKTEWILRNLSDNEHSDLVDSLQLEGVSGRFLANLANWQRLDDGFKINPPGEVVAGIPPGSRMKLYSVLTQDSENMAQRNPYRIPQGFPLSDWFADSALSAERIELFSKLTYTNGETLCFADMAAFNELSSPAETAQLLKSLSRVPTYMLRLHIEPETPVDQLLRYWGKFGNPRDMRLLFQSISRVDSDINLTAFLPPIPRLLLYTYPRPDDPGGAELNDVWTAMNFFNKEQDNRFLDAAYAQKVLASEYMRVSSKARQFGDVIVLVGPQNKMLHICVHLADDFVFTKRAPGLFEPWVIMKLKELISVYQPNRPFEVRFHRIKKFPAVAITAWPERDEID